MEIIEIQDVKDGIVFSVRVQPRASKNEIVGLPSGNLKIKIVAPPVEGAANQLCIRLLSKWLCINKSRIEIVSGLKSKNKRIKIDGLNKKDFSAFIKNQ